MAAVDRSLQRVFGDFVGMRSVVTVDDRLVQVSSRGPGFDHVRLVAAAIVLLHHSRGLQYSDIRDDPLLHFSAGYMDFGRLAVVIFFAISGFLVTPGLVHTANVLNYGVNRCVRIFPGLIVNVALTVLLLGPCLTTYSLGAYFGDPKTYLYAKNILTLMVDYLPGVVTFDGRPAVVNGALWTLHFEVLCYILLGLLCAVGLLSRRYFVLALWCASYAAYVAIGNGPEQTGDFGRLGTFLSLFVFFGNGVLLYLFRERIPFSLATACAAIGVIAVALPLGAGRAAMPVCLPYLMICVGLSALPRRMHLKHDLSYGVYLIHAPVLLAFSLMFPNMHTWPIGAAVVLVITLMLSYASWTLIEGPALNQKTTVAKWIRGRLEAVIPPLKARTAGRPATSPKLGNVRE